MSLFGVETERLVRTKWKSAQALAQEVYALLSGNIPITTNAPIVINMPPGATTTPLQINTDSGGAGMSIQTGGDTFSFGGNGGLNLTLPGFNPGGGGAGTGTGGGAGGGGLGGGGGSGGGGLDLGGIVFPGQDPNQVTAAVPAVGNNPFTLEGKVVASNSDGTWQVDVWAKPPATNPKIGTLTVRFPNVDPAETIPAGFSCPVVCYPGLDSFLKRTILDAVSWVPVYAQDSPA